MCLGVKTIWQQVSLKRVLAFSVVIALAAFMLFFFLASLGDSDLPPYDPPFPGERLGWKVLAVVVWPLILAVRLVGHDPPFVFWFPLMFVGAIFWACLIETCIVFRNAWRA